MITTTRRTGARRIALAAALLTVAGLVSGGVLGGGTARADNGIDTLSAQQIADRSRDALLGVRSLHLGSRGDLSGRNPSARLELTMDRDGNCDGSVDLGGGRGSVRIVKRADDVWLKPDADFWKNQVPVGGPAFAAILDGRYLRASADDPRLHGVTAGCDLDHLRRLVVDNAENDRGTLNKGRRTTLDGAPVVPLTRIRDGRTLTMYVAATGRPYPLRITVEGGGAHAVADLSAFDAPVPATTPPPDETYDVNALLGRTTAPL
ncbi:hypothetical protein ACFYXM_30040 [Streptomyces sp. NPDC002476]|uniref:hypothetical protein n=1 Tax=Streptomyces sp. NPDC002476 TaxID=3364648 RepID=UPI0036BE83C9